MDLASRLFKGDRVIWIIFMFLCLISVVEVFSATSTLAYKSVTHWQPIARHASFLFAGFVTVLVIHNIPCRFYQYSMLLMPLSVILLLMLYIPGFAVVINGEPRWLNLGVTFQPSEVAKIAMICYSAFILSKYNKLTDKQMFWSIQIGAAIVCGLILTNNGSTAILLFSVVQMMMFFGQISLKRLIKCWSILVVTVALLVALLYFAPDSVMKYMPDRVHTWKARIERFFDGTPEIKVEKGKAVKIDGDVYQVVQGKIAIAHGGVWGQLPGYGQQRDFLPQAFSDFIYAIIIEEMGLVGGFFVLFLYMALLFRAGMIARRCEKLLPKYLVMGCALLVVLQALTNMAVAVDMIPVTGQPLPLISRGGTSTFISCIYFGIILGVSRFGANIGNEDDDILDDEGSSKVNSGELTDEDISNWTPDTSVNDGEA